MKPTPAARALVGCLALADGKSTNQAFALAGYSVALPVSFYRGRTYRRVEAARLITRNGRVVKASQNAIDASMWLLRMGRKLAAMQGVAQ